MLEFRDRISVPNLDDNSIILDIETTGVSRTDSSVIIVGIIDSSGNIMQFSIDNIEEEAQLLKTVKPHLDNRDIITYNGQNFDIPFLKSRYEFFNMESFEENSQFDIYRYFITNRLITDIETFNLQDIEKYFTIDRFENFEFEKDRDIYKDLNNIDLEKILLHNKYDIVNTYKVLEKIETIEDKKKFSIENTDFYIQSINIDKNFLELNIYTKNLDIDHFYQNKNYKLEWTRDVLKIKLKIIRGYIADNVIGYVHILDTNLENIDNKDYNLPENIVIVFDERYFIENIKEIVKYLIQKYINL